MSKPGGFSRVLLHEPAPTPVRLREDELDPLAIFRLVRRRIWTILIVTALVFAASLPSILSIKPVYFAEARLLIQKPLTSRLSSAEDSEVHRLNLTTELERLLARSTAARMVETLHLAEREEFNPALRQPSTTDWLRGWMRGLFIAEEAAGMPADPLDQIIPEFLGALSVVRNPASDVIQIGFRSRDPELAAAVPSALLDIYLDGRKNHLDDQIGQASAWLDKRIEEQRDRVEQVLLQAPRFGVEAGLALNDASAAIGQTIATLMARRAEIVQKRAEQIAVLAALDDARTRQDRLLVADSPVLSELSGELRLLEMEIDRLLRVYGNKHADIVSMRKAIEETEAKIDVEIGRYRRSLETRALALDREEKAVVAGLETARATLLRQDRAEAQRDEILRLVRIEQAALDRLETQRLALEADAKLPVTDIEVLSPATIPLYPEGRGRLIYLIGALLAGGVVGLTVACAREILDGSVRAHQQLEGIPGLVPAGMIPALPRRLARRGGTSPMFRDAILGLALSLEQSNDGTMPSSILVTSSVPGEGKSVIAATLALELAASGRRVLLVDADVRRGRIGNILGGGGNAGLTDFIAGTRRLPDVVHHHAESGLDYIPRGTGRPEPLHDRSTVAKLIQFARDRQQVVIFDSSPVLANSETSLLGSLVERTVLLVRWGRLSRGAIAAAAERLQSGRRDEILVALNMVDPRRHALYGFKDAEIYSSAVRRYHAAAKG